MKFDEVDTDYSIIKQVLARNQEELMCRYNAIGSGIGTRNGKPAIILMVKNKKLEDLPLEIEGYPLFIDEIGGVNAY